MPRQFFNLAEVMGQVDQARVRDKQMQGYDLDMQRQQREMERQARQDADLDAQKGIYRGAIETVDGNASLNEKKLIEGMLQQNPEMALKLQQQFQDRDINAGKLKNENAKSELSLKTEKAKYWRDVLATATPETYQGIMQQAQQDGMGFAVNAPQQFDPNFIKQNVMTADKFLESTKIKAPTTRTVRIGNDTVTQQFNDQTGQFEEVGRGSAFAPINPDAGQPVAVMGEDGKPIYVPKGQAIGKRPYSAAQDAKDAAKVGQQEQAALSAQQAIDQAEALFTHPGRGAGTGFSSFTSKIPGTDAKGFQANLDTFKAQTFLPMVSALKGMGALSDAEGKKIADSVGALDPSMPEAEFAKSLQTTTKFLFDKAKAAGLNVVLPDFAKPKKAPPPPPKKGAVVDGYVFLGGDPANEKNYKKAK